MGIYGMFSVCVKESEGVGTFIVYYTPVEIHECVFNCSISHIKMLLYNDTRTIFTLPYRNKSRITVSMKYIEFRMAFFPPCIILIFFMHLKVSHNYISYLLTIVLLSTSSFKFQMSIVDIEVTKYGLRAIIIFLTLSGLPYVKLMIW